MCKVESCTKRAKSRGICWSHGGGTRCKFDCCTKIAVSLGLCWAHGGGASRLVSPFVYSHNLLIELLVIGKRCIVHGCRKPASERTDNFCNEHFTNSRAGTLQSQTPPPSYEQYEAYSSLV